MSDNILQLLLTQNQQLISYLLSQQAPQPRVGEVMVAPPGYNQPAAPQPRVGEVMVAPPGYNQPSAPQPRVGEVMVAPPGYNQPAAHQPRVREVMVAAPRSKRVEAVVEIQPQPQRHQLQTTFVSPPIPQRREEPRQEVQDTQPSSSILDINPKEEEVFILCRVSSNSQNNPENASLETQLSACGEIVKKLKGKSNNVYTITQSGYHSILDDEENLIDGNEGKSLQWVWKIVLNIKGKKKNKKSPVIVVRTASRLTRNSRDAQVLLAKLKEKKGRIIFGVANESGEIAWHSTETQQGSKLFIQQVQVSNAQITELIAASKASRAAKKRKINPEVEAEQRYLKSIQKTVAGLSSNTQAGKQLNLIKKFIIDAKTSISLEQVNTYFRSFVNWAKFPRYTTKEAYEWLDKNVFSNKEIAGMLAEWDVKIPNFSGGLTGTNWTSELISALEIGQDLNHITQQLTTTTILDEADNDVDDEEIDEEIEQLAKPKRKNPKGKRM